MARHGWRGMTNKSLYHGKGGICTSRQTNECVAKGMKAYFHNRVLSGFVFNGFTIRSDNGLDAGAGSLRLNPTLDKVGLDFPYQFDRASNIERSYLR